MGAHAQVSDPKVALIDQKIEDGYAQILEDDLNGGVTQWKKAWYELKTLMEREDIPSLSEVHDRFEWRECVIEYAHNFLDELGNAGKQVNSFHRARIEYGHEMLRRSADEVELQDHARIAILDSHSALGEMSIHTQLTEKWLNGDPDWGAGYIAQALCSEESEHPIAVAEILERGLKREGLRDRQSVLRLAIKNSQKAGNAEQTRHYKAELKKLRDAEMQDEEEMEFHIPIRPEPAISVKIGRNEPCPCGSGKKYKKCCGA